MKSPHSATNRSRCSSVMLRCRCAWMMALRGKPSGRNPRRSSDVVYRGVGGPGRFTRELGFQYIDVHRHLNITDEQRERFIATYFEALDEAGMPNDGPSARRSASMSSSAPGWRSRTPAQKPRRTCIPSARSRTGTGAPPAPNGFMESAESRPRLPSRWAGVGAKLPPVLDNLAGPSGGVVELPIDLAWSGDRSFDLADPVQRYLYHVTVLTSAVTREHYTRWLNASLLRGDWGGLHLPRPLREIWQEHFPESGVTGRPCSTVTTGPHARALGDGDLGGLGRRRRGRRSPRPAGTGARRSR